MLDNDSEEDIESFEVDFTVPANAPTLSLTDRHDFIAGLLQLPPGDNNLTQLIFKTIASLCDPFTQPEESADFVLSVDCIADLAIAVLFKSYIEEQSADDIPIESIKFDISTILFTILSKIHVLLNADDELELR